MIKTDKISTVLFIPFKCRLEITVTLFNLHETSLKIERALLHGLVETSIEDFLNIHDLDILPLQELAELYRQLTEGYDVYKELVQKIRVLVG